jgi:hypothetical protein
MKTILLLSLCFYFVGCAISHKRGSDAQVAVDYYLENRGELPNELTKLVTQKDLTEADVTIQWTINEKGQTKDVSISHDTLHNEKVNTLLVEHLKAMNFPKSPRFTTTTVEYTYKFQTQKKQ